MYKIKVFVITLIFGIFAVCGAIFDPDWFFDDSKTRLFVRIFGRKGARIFYGALGFAVIVFSLYYGALIFLANAS